MTCDVDTVIRRLRRRHKALTWRRERSEAYLARMLEEGAPPGAVQVARNVVAYWSGLAESFRIVLAELGKGSSP